MNQCIMKRYLEHGVHAKASYADNQVYYNHTGDADLKKLIYQIIKTSIEEIKTLLK